MSTEPETLSEFVSIAVEGLGSELKLGQLVNDRVGRGHHVIDGTTRAARSHTLSARERMSQVSFRLALTLIPL